MEGKVSEKSTIETKNVLILALSTFRARKIENNEDENIFAVEQSIWSYGEENGVYYHQAEPIPMMMSKEKAPDYCIVLGTKETSKEQNFIFLGADNNDVVSESAEEYLKNKLKEVGEEKGVKVGYKYLEYEIEGSNDTVSRNVEKIVYDIVNYIRKISENYNVDLYVDEHGGLRDTQRVISSIVSLLDGEEHVIDDNKLTKISLKKVYTMGKLVEGKYPIYESNYDIVDFVSGINEFLNYGRVDSLVKFYKNERGDEAENARELINILKNIASGIQLCDLNMFDEGLDRLKEYQKCLVDNNDISYLSIFKNTIFNEYGKIINAKNELVRLKEEVSWCTRKGYYQQALTIIEGRTPYVFKKEKILTCDMGAYVYAYNKNSDYFPAVLLFNDLVISNLKKTDLNEYIYNDAPLDDNDYNSNIPDSDKYEYNAETDNYKRVKRDGGKEYIIFVNPDIIPFLRLYRCLKQRRNSSNHVSFNCVTDMETDRVINKIEDCLKRYVLLLTDIIDNRREYIKIMCSPISESQYDFRRDINKKYISYLLEVYNNNPEAIYKYYAGDVSNKTNKKMKKLFLSLKIIRENEDTDMSDNEIHKFIDDDTNRIYKSILYKWIQSVGGLIDDNAMVNYYKRGINEFLFFVGINRSIVSEEITNIHL